MPLDPEIAAYLEESRYEPPRSTLSIEELRASMRQSAERDGPSLNRVEDLRVAGRPARRYSPSEATDLPIVVYFHGGSFFAGGLDTHDVLCRHLAQASGASIVAIDYRLAPEHVFPAAYEDACAAVEWALAQTDRVAVAGDSAGANLAAGAAQEHRSVRAQLLVYPMLDGTCDSESYERFATGYGLRSEDLKRGWEVYVPLEIDRQDPRVSPIFVESLEGLPPAYIATAEYDPLRDEGEEYAKVLADCILQRYPGTIHGFFSKPARFRVAREAIADAGAFLRQHL
jgi:acetyl esterase